MKTIIETLGIKQIGTVSANNKYPTFVGADSGDGVTVTKPLHEKIYEEIHLMFVARLNYHTFSTDSHLTKRYKTILNLFGEDVSVLSNRYEIRRKGNTFYIQKTNAMGKVFQFAIHVSVLKGELKYRYVWKKKLKKFVDGYRVKMRMFASHQLGVNQVKVYKSVV